MKKGIEYLYVLFLYYDDDLPSFLYSNVEIISYLKY